MKVKHWVHVTQDNVGYLTTINVQATELITVAEILKQPEIIHDTLRLPKIVVVMDQALCAKAYKRSHGSTEIDMPT